MSGSEDTERDGDDDAAGEERPAPLSDLAKQLDDESTPSDSGSNSHTGDAGGPTDESTRSETPGSDDFDTGDLDTDDFDTGSFDAEAEGTGDEAPLGSIAEEVRQRRERRARERESDAESGLFEEMDVGEVDSDELWDTIFGEAETEQTEGTAVGAGAEAERVGSAPGADDRPEHRLPKEKYCQRCPYLASPPTVACEHDGTDIVEVSDSEHFVVRGCPFAEQDDPDLRTFE